MLVPRSKPHASSCARALSRPAATAGTGCVTVRQTDRPSRTPYLRRVPRDVQFGGIPFLPLLSGKDKDKTLSRAGRTRSGFGHAHAAPGCENSSYFGPPSEELIRIAPEIKKHSNAPILDAGCGYGRNAIALAARGLSVLCVDQELERLNVLVRFAPKHIARLREPESESGHLYSVLAQLGPSHWPFRENCFGGIVCVHFLNVALFGAFQSSLVTGGYLYIETFGGHGGNYLDLPKAGQLHDLLRADFHLPFYRERKVGPEGHDAVAVKLIGRKRSPVAAPPTIRTYL